MKNNIKVLIFVFLILILNLRNLYSAEEFNFDVTEIEILNEGNLINGLKRGTATTNEGLKITADEFEYDKILNILKATGNVELKDNLNDYIIFSEKITYLKGQGKYLHQVKQKL